MFKIKYRITTNIKNLTNLSKQEIKEGGDIEGYFELTVNDKNYGYFKEGPLEEDESGLELTTHWFETLLKLLLKFKEGHDYVVISDIELYETWIEFKKLKNEKISISVIKAKKKEGTYSIETTPPENIVYSDWAHEVVTYDKIFNEVVKKTKEYIDEVRLINEKLAEGQTFIELKKLLLDVQAK